MSIWLPDLSRHQGPRYIAIADALAGDLNEGRIAPGTRLPPQRDLAWRLKVTVGTVARAYAEAARRGLVSGEVGRGTYVLDPKEHRDGLTILHKTLAEFTNVRPTMAASSTCRSTGRPAATARPSWPTPCAAWPTAPISRACWAIASIRPGPGMRRRPRNGFRARASTSPPTTRFFTVGGQQAIVAVMAALTRSADVIFTEELTYPGIKRTASLIDREIEGVAMDEGGMRPDALEAALAKRPGSVIYCMPTLQNPTTITMSLERRHAIVAIARRHRATLVEDGIYAFLVEGAPPPL